MKRMITALGCALGLAAAFVPGMASAQTTAVPVIAFVTQQPTNEWLAGVFIGAKVKNDAGNTVGDIYDLLFSPQGQINTVVLGGGGFYGRGRWF